MYLFLYLYAPICLLVSLRSFPVTLCHDLSLVRAEYWDDKLAARSVLVVSINYRVGALGECKLKFSNQMQPMYHLAIF